MTLFLKRLQYFLAFTFILITLLATGFFTWHNLSWNDLPAPYLSSNFHYNEKLRFIRNSEIKPDVIYAGSSMALANFHSETLTENLGTDAHLNFSSQGLTLEHFVPLLKIQTEIHRPHSVIFATNMYEFTSRNILFSYDLIEDYLESNSNPYQFYIKRFNLRYFMDHFPRIQTIRSQADGKFELSYDKHGTVNIETVGTPEHRYWNRTFLDSNHIYRYEHLEELALFASENNMELIFVQTPIRSELFESLSGEEKKLRDQHIDRIRDLSASYGFTFIDSNTIEWGDSLFANGTHLNVYGAKKFSRFILDRLRSNQEREISK